MFIKETLKVIGLSGITYLIGCASTAPSPELVDARKAFRQAEQGQAAQLVPDRVLTAQEALQRAERTHAEDPGSEQERHFGYLAERHSQIAMAYSDIEQAQRNRAQAQTLYTQTQEQLLRQSQGQVQKLRGQSSETQQQLSAQQTELEQERQARLQAEERAQAAMRSLKEVAMVKEDAQETKITLSGSVIFKTNQADLLPIAEQQLQRVAEVLRQQEGKNIIIEGYTDSRGSADYNERLSQSRARAVRDYLISQGLPAERVQAVGRGEANPIASNDTPEGRANNRRVEIIVRDETGAS